MKYYIYENKCAEDFEPLSLTRPAFDLRCGPFTFLERLFKLIPDSAEVSLIVRENLVNLAREMYPDLKVNPGDIEQGIWLLGNVFWREDDLKQITKTSSEIFQSEDMQIGANLSQQEGSDWMNAGGPVSADLQLDLPTTKLDSLPVNYLWEILQKIPWTMEEDTRHFPKRNEIVNSDQNLQVINPSNIWIGEPDKVKPAVVIDASKGSVIIEKNVDIGPFSYLKGPLFIGEGTIISPHSQIKESVLGPVCRVGGEVAGTIIQGWSNKVHDGYLGDAFLGEWVNLGAGTNNSNLKNNYTSVKVTVNGKIIDTGSLFIGSFIGDHSKTAIGTQLNTGTSIGTGCNIVSKGFPPRFIQPFTWLMNGKHVSTKIETFIKTGETVKSRRGLSFSAAERELFNSLFVQKKNKGV
ncbi:MAG TPA: putative sugar nucleotidyl transferase [Candidatus Marinimicrobia bacterium]|mgnify:CR=1 FL=1|jgi:UDP-N-acetylglucosamine diphosphorylase/glucosamine-1-phosphate N-acetyltransferase|nr:putative sugar nucleotidyl transferase [Candidatus Neomarinimicrobiota bacterium]MDP6260630.1 putative sugar nucleotidyl transferase [Candidatus Neomarinimicrobiota bacterium]MDP7127396.1 putative sugar nucleotidyl transferase [Candidatus Neomarinimicrobiota bacterium]MDP7337342.1 putative sugar nucleotidyl transferase [Candidatus Neomarinimicrobiota bacterium]MDP7475327.1 putative sugar nucleotidyl transferase [Candidatus Neomarinimicrobiota bacterium]|tara:strand:+ start:1342 stop:2565 length:1224 start_codon:yes stop_codon:yes gene_type:complete